MKKKSNRKAVVFTTLIGVLTLTSALLLILQPAPLTPDGNYVDAAINAPEAMNAIFQTQTPVKPGRWKYIYIHHSRTLGGSAASLTQDKNGAPDHFVICNGQGAADGQVQVSPRWDEQLSATPAGTAALDPACISICLIGDFDHAVPTPMQIQRLTSLVNTLQGRFDIPAGQVLVLAQGNSPAGIGQYFPATAFREQLLP